MPESLLAPSLHCQQGPETCDLFNSSGAGLFLLGQYKTGQVSQLSSESTSKPKGIISPHSHNQPSEDRAIRAISQKGHLSILNLNLYRTGFL